MNKLGSVHSDGKQILPIGRKLSLRCMIDDWQKGNYWQKAIAYHDDTAFYMYPNKRTYLQQIQDAVKENCTELNLVIDTAGYDYSNVTGFVVELIKKCRSLGYYNEIIIDCFNEPLEKWNFSFIDDINKRVSYTITGFNNVSLAVGDMSVDFIDYYKHLLMVSYKFKYISFHTDNDCDLDNFERFYGIMPSNIYLINNEHYNFNGALKYGYDDPNVISELKEYTDLILKLDRIKSVYITCPYGVKDNPFGDGLFLNKIDSNTEKIYTTKAWIMLKEFDIKEGVIMKLETLQKGSWNWQVRVLQTCLIANGQELGNIDGGFGDKTEKALISFNDEHYIKNNNVCSLATWYTFMIEVNSMELMKDFISILSLL